MDGGGRYAVFVVVGGRLRPGQGDAVVVAAPAAPLAGVACPTAGTAGLVLGEAGGGRVGLVSVDRPVVGAGSGRFGRPVVWPIMPARKAVGQGCEVVLVVVGVAVVVGAFAA